MKNAKLNLNDLKVSSFVTNFDPAKEETVKGGVGSGTYTVLGPQVCHIGTRDDTYDAVCPIPTFKPCF